ncbi:MAG: hypothetical protein AB7V16_03780 [Vulcanibacillus sp.]
MKKLIFLIIAIVVISNYSSLKVKESQDIVEDYFNYDMLQENLLDEEYLKLDESSLEDNKIEEFITDNKDKDFDLFVEGFEDKNPTLNEIDILKLFKDNLNLINIDDKFRLISISLGNFTLNELNDWKNRASDGLTDNEKKELEELVHARLSNQELAELKELAYKYLTLFTEINQETVNVMLN